MLRVSNVAEPADIVPCLRELCDEAGVAVNPDGGFGDFAAQHSEFITRLLVLSAGSMERLLQDSLKLLWPKLPDNRCKNFAGMVCGNSHCTSVSRSTTTGEKQPVGNVLVGRKINGYYVYPSR